MSKDTGSAGTHLEKVLTQLERYEHPLFTWEASAVDAGVEVLIRLKHPGIWDDPYRILLRPRELDAQGFEWDFQRQLYNYLHDYLVEMFTRSPHIHDGV